MHVTEEDFDGHEVGVSQLAEACVCAYNTQFSGASLKVMTGFSSTFKLVPENCVSYVTGIL